MAFNPARLKLARERRNLFANELATYCGVTANTISNWERGSTSPPEVDRLAAALNFPEEFFFLPDPVSLKDGAASFRSRSRIPRPHRRAALAAGVLAGELATWIEQRFDLPPVALPDLRGQAPDLAAEIIRAEWMLGEKPVPNVIHLLESRGALVFSLAQDCRAIDAFSFWSGGRPIVLLNLMKSAERSRLDGAHELFHLIAHKEETGKKEEWEADAFAGEFLMPSRDVQRHLSGMGILGLQQLIRAKARWGTSLAALVYRVHELRIISDWQYRTLFVELSKRGYRSREPQAVSRDSSTLLSKVFESLRLQGITPRQVAKELHWHPSQLHELIFGLGAALLPVDGGGSGGTSTRPKLRSV
jgi:Zn-dependent peptidase ImmA (M78 family)